MVSARFLSSQSQQLQNKNTAGRVLVYILLSCSAILLFKSYQLESVRFEAFIRNSVTTSNRLLPEADHASSGMGNIGSTEFYIPSLDYRIKGVSQYSSNGKKSFEAHVYCQEFEKDLLWEWWRPNDGYDQENKRRRSLRQKERGRTTIDSMGTGGNKRMSIGNDLHTTRKRLLIGITSGYDDHARLLERAIWSARVYGALWSDGTIGTNLENMDVTVVALQGTAFSPHGCKSPPSYSSVDKIRVLFEAIDSDSRYDRLLLLDTDTMIYDMDTDLTLQVDGNDDFVVMGPPVLTKDGKRDKNKPWEISSGMTLWNLEHPLTRTVALDWFKYAKNAIIRGSYQSDQKYLHKALQLYYSTDQNGTVKRSSDRNIGIIQIFSDKWFAEDTKGTFVKQFGVQTVTGVENDININIGETDHNEQIESRLARMEETARQICGRYPDACKKVGAPPRYETS